MAAIEAPGMIARILLIGKLSSAAIPFQGYFVFGHVFYMECGQALGTISLLRGSLDPRFHVAQPAGCAMVWQTRVTTADGKLIAIVTQTQLVLVHSRAWSR